VRFGQPVTMRFWWLGFKRRHWGSRSQYLYRVRALATHGAHCYTRIPLTWSEVIGARFWTSPMSVTIVPRRSSVCNCKECVSVCESVRTCPPTLHSPAGSCLQP
jgi:hypothetical protein